MRLFFTGLSLFFTRLSRFQNPLNFGNRFPTLVTHLAMQTPFPPHQPTPSLHGELPDGLRIEPQTTMPLSAYRALYHAVGQQWRWVNRRHLSDRQLSALIHNPHIEIFVLRDGAHNVGYVELNFRQFPEVEIVFFGLIDSYIGRGIGPNMLAYALDYIRQRQATRIIIQTCTLDHPSALPLYQKAGFTPFKHKHVTVIDRAG